jgi:hypothetical protein
MLYISWYILHIHSCKIQNPSATQMVNIYVINWLFFPKWIIKMYTKNLKLNFLLNCDVNTVRWLTGVQFLAVAEILLLKTPFRLALGPTQPLSNKSPGVVFRDGESAGVGIWPFTSLKCRGYERVSLYLHSPIHDHRLVLIMLCTEATELAYTIYNQI